MARQNDDPYRNFNFVVEIDGIKQARLHRLQRFRLDASTRSSTARAGRTRRCTSSRPDQVPQHRPQMGPHRLARALRLARRRRERQGPARRTARIVVYDVDGAPSETRWNFFNAWPTKWDGPDFNAEGTDVAIETLELAHEGIETGLGEHDPDRISSSRCPCGYQDEEGTLHRDGAMRLRDGGRRDPPLRDPRVQANRPI